MVDGIGGNFQPVGRLTSQKSQSNAQKNTGDTLTKTPVAKAVARFVYDPKATDEVFSKLEYDKPTGENDVAMGAYQDVMNFHKKEYLAGLVGVDIYV